MSASPSVSNESIVNVNDYVVRDLKMKSRNNDRNNDMGETDIMTASTTVKPTNFPLSQFASSLPVSASSNPSSTPVQFNLQNNHLPQSCPPQNINHQSAEVTDLSDSSGGTDGSKTNGSPPYSIPQQNNLVNNVNNNMNQISQPPSLASPALGFMPESNSVDVRPKTESDNQTKSGFLGGERISISCWSQAPRGRESVLRRLSETLIRGSLTLIDLSQRNLGPNDARLIRLAILHNPNLSVLKLGYNQFGDEGISLIASAIHGHTHLSILDVGFNCIGDIGCSSLALDAVANNYVLHTLYLSGNSIGENGAFALSQAIIGDGSPENGSGCGLRCLHLTANRIKANGVKALTRAITISESRKHDKHLSFQGGFQIQGANDHNMFHDQSKSQFQDHRLQELFLGGTDMRSVGCLAVSNMMLTNFSLRVLSLSHNGITDKDLILFSQSLSRNKSVPIEVLQLSFNQLTCEGVESLMNVVWGSKTLKDLRLDNNKIRDRGAQLVAVVLTSVDLERVDLGFNIITTVGIKALMKSLAENESLQSLTLSGNALDTSASKAVSYALAYNKVLKCLYMDNCSVGYAAQRHIAAGAASNSSSSLRTLTGFRIGAIAVTLGLPSALENWANDQVLGFFRLMWEKWRQENLNDKDGEDPVRGSCNSLPVTITQNPQIHNTHTNQKGSTMSLNGDHLNKGIKKNGPMDPNTVVLVAKTTYENLGKDNSALLHWQNNHREVSLQSPLAPNDEMILETTASGETRIPPVNNFSINDESFKLDNESNSIRDMNGQTFSFPLESNDEKLRQIDPKKKDKLMRWLTQHASSLNEVSQYPYDNADMWRLHQHFFSPVCNAEAIKANNAVPNNNSILDGGDSPMIPEHESDTNATVPVQRPDPLIPLSGAAQSSNIRSMMGRKSSYHSLTDSIISVPQNNATHSQPQCSPGATRRHSEMDENASPSMQPAQKRAKKARISYFPRVKTKLELLRTKTSEHQALVLMRQLKYIENAMLGDNIFQSDPDGFTSADAESILMML